MSTRFHGVMSLTLVGVALVLATYVMLQSALGWALGYLLLSLVGAGGVLYAYCAKCPCKDCCAHVFPGKVAARFSRPSSPYSNVEFAVVIAALLFILGFPQLWLWRYPVLFVIFWILNAIAVTQILVVICRACPNTHCPIGRMRRG